MVFYDPFGKCNDFMPRLIAELCDTEDIDVARCKVSLNFLSLAFSHPNMQ